MIMAAGIGAYSAAMFHLMTHAFFKATLFLGAGIAIHALNGEQSLDRMGGLKGHLRLCWLAMGSGCLAIAGFPGFSGFFSKDEILGLALSSGTVIGVLGWAVGTLAALLTAIYMFRMLFRAFWGPEPDGGYDPVPHPSRAWMGVPVAILGVLAAIGGWIQVPHGWQGISDWLAPVLADVPQPLEMNDTAETVSLILGAVVCIVGIGIAWWLFGADPQRRLRLAGKGRGTRRVLAEGYEFDAVYDEAIVGTTRDLGDALGRTFEPDIAGGLVRGTQATVAAGARVMRSAENGLVRTYAFALIAGVGAAAIVVVLAVVR